MRDYLFASLAILGLMFGWILVQQGWRTLFPEYLTDEDVLALREECHSCNGSCSPHDALQCHSRPSTPV